MTSLEASTADRSRSPARTKPIGALWTANEGASASVPPPGPGESVVAPFTYQGDAVPKGLLATGKVGTKRDGTGSDGEYFGCDFVRRDCKVTNGRGRSFNLDDHGFQLADHVIDHIDYYNEDEVLRKYYPLCCDLVKRMTGAKTCFAFDHNVRSKALSEAKKGLKGGNAVQGPAFVVHNDYSTVSAPRRVRDLSTPPKLNDTLRPLLGETPLVDPSKVEDLLKGRWAIINVWRNIKKTPVQKLPLGLCEGPTVKNSDIITFEIHYADRIGENYFAAHSESHEWFYFPEIQRDEAILLKCWDSAGEAFASPDFSGSKVPATFSFHSAFEDPSSKAGAEDRESIEVRTLAFF
eukprot:TRINITY_DN48359_c0_g1_i1.p1 TRINITY_DN48359_c0_g1~~TRINITY_DN48359_c0_g1_i1.p1  ORF type:complete len:362 (+),score=46.45 TRINITY_DN48359_c0_g1_i1:38-1087(+)